MGWALTTSGSTNSSLSSFRRPAAWVRLSCLLPRSARFRCAIRSLCFLIVMLTHYAAAGPLAGLTLFALIRRDRRLRSCIFWSLIIATVIYSVAWGLFFLRQRDAFHTNMLWTIEA